jgi:preprotein translocase subunit SecE
MVQYPSMVNPVTYLREVSQELQRVSWPSRQKTLNMTLLVIVISLVIALILAGSDFVFQQLLSFILK